MNAPRRCCILMSTLSEQQEYMYINTNRAEAPEDSSPDLRKVQTERGQNTAGMDLTDGYRPVQIQGRICTRTYTPQHRAPEAPASTVGFPTRRMGNCALPMFPASRRVKWSTRHSDTDRGSADFFSERASRETINGRRLWEGSS